MMTIPGQIDRGRGIVQGVKLVVTPIGIVMDAVILDERTRTMKRRYFAHVLQLYLIRHV